MKVVTLASSSKGNSTLIYTDKTKILIDAGLLLSEIELKLTALNILPGEINAILLTHEHSDHIKGIGPFMRKYHTPLYVHNLGMVSAIKKLGNINENLVIPFYDKPFMVGEFKITSFNLPHDAHHCVGYSIEKDDKKVSIATDFGHTNVDIVKNLYNSRLVILESNHDEKMLLQNQNYSSLLKSRILGKNGHLSNVVAAKLVCDLANNNVKQVLLAHLSEENNTPQLAYDTVKQYLQANEIEIGKNIMVDVASAHKISTIFHLK